MRAIRYLSAANSFLQTGHSRLALAALPGKRQCGQPKTWQSLSLEPGKTADLILSPFLSTEEHKGQLEGENTFFERFSLFFLENANKGLKILNAKIKRAIITKIKTIL